MAINYLDLMDLHHDTLHMLNIFKAKYQPIIIGVHLVHMIHANFYEITVHVETRKPRWSSDFPQTAPKCYRKIVTGGENSN